MYKSKHIIGKRNDTIRRFAFFFMAFMLFCSVLSLFNYPRSHISADTDSSTERKLQNGSFEDGPSFSGNYSQPDQSAVPYWNTTAFQSKIELFKKNTNTYISGVTLEPTDGTYAAELNADEESTLYQNVKTSPLSVYEWGLDHGGRNGTDTMALIIGPKQSVDPSKPSKAGRDQLMQMVDWLIAQGKTSVKTSSGLGEQLTVYSKKFATSGTFEDNAGNNAFSLTPSTIYTEEWHIWIMADSKVTSGTNPWGSYGSNADESSEDDTGLDLDKYYLYTVPTGQTDTLFAFVSVGYDKSSTSADKAKTYGNFLDNINFQLYHPLSSSTTNHGSAVISESDGTIGGEGASGGHEVSIDNKLQTYVKDGEPLKIQAIVKKADADDGCEFVGTYYTTQDENGNSVTKFLILKGNVIDDTGNLTDEDKNGTWIKSTNTNGDIIYTYYLENVTSSTDLHFVFIKSPTVTYDSNGGKEYVVERKYNTNEAPNVYSFKPASGIDEATAETKTFFIDPYVSHAAEGQNDGWKFMGWLLTGDTVDNIPTDIQVNANQLGSLILPAEHTIACDYTFDGVNGDMKAQYFKIYNGNVTLTKHIDENANTHEDLGVTWNDNGEEKVYANVHKGITMVAQWRWRQAFIPQKLDNSTNKYINSNEGGTVEITSVTDKSNENYNANYNENSGKSYHATTGELVTVTATAKENYSFIGWYDESGNLVATNPNYAYYETQESVKTFYARFSNSVTQTYIRQVKNGDSWDNIEGTNTSEIGNLGRYTYTDAVGMPVSSTATAGSGYKFIGWYDSNGNPVSEDMLTNDGATISYTTTGNATYYARFEATVTQTFTRQVKNGNTWKNTTEDTIGTLTLYSHTDVVGKNVSSKATAGQYYIFEGWYDSNGIAVSNDILTSNGTTISYTTTSDATYYARFSKKEVTQNFIRQVKNGDSWENITDTTDDTIATLSRYEHTGEVQQTVESTATVTIGSGYKFVGWYDSDGNKVGNDMLKEDDEMTISYITTDNATYYARFEITVTETYIRQVRDGDTLENTTDNSIGTLSDYDHTDVAGTTVSSTATAGTNYIFEGWYDSNNNLITESETISHTITDGAIYYARFSKKEVTQKFIRQIKNGDTWEDITNDSVGTLSIDTHTDVIGVEVSSTATVGSGYKFIGWYDSSGNKVSDGMLADDGMTINYTTTDDATYYARFEKLCTLNVSKLDGDKSTNENKVPLADAEFTLYQEDSSGDKTIVYNGVSIKCISVGVAVTVLSENDTKAIAVFKDMLSCDKVYYLAETKAPTGYRLLDTALKITFEDSDNVLINGISKSITDNEVNIELANYLTLHMPTSGTSFTDGWFAVVGLSLLALATIGLFGTKISRYKQK